jgi:hypothetical protein
MYITYLASTNWSVAAKMDASRCQQEAAAAAVTQTVQHLLARYVEPVVPDLLQQVIRSLVAVGTERLDQLQQ